MSVHFSFAIFAFTINQKGNESCDDIFVDAFFLGQGQYEYAQHEERTR
jgi:hypothetical protein